jgi:type I restriction enzyme R subunit
LNQNSEQLAREEIDRELIAGGWIIQDKPRFNLSAGLGVAIGKCQIDNSPADCILLPLLK